MLKVKVKQSKFYATHKIHGAVCHYWWDVSPSEKGKFSVDQVVRFMKKDTGEYADLHAPYLVQFLAEERRTTRGEGNWGILVLKDAPDHLAIDPGNSGQDWLMIPVVWNR